MTLNATGSLNSARRPGTILIVLSALHFAFFFCSLVAIPILAPGARIPNPFSLDDGGAHVLPYGLHGHSRERLSSVCLRTLPRRSDPSSQ